MLTALVKLARYLGWTLVLLPVQAVAVALHLPLAKRIPVIYHREVCRILGLSVRLHGKPSRARPTLFVANHTSYLDIAVLGSLLRVSFVAKAEVRSWPLYGLLAKLQRTVFVGRRLSRTAAEQEEIRRRLEAGDSLVLFPEGTSDDGNRVLPFKSAFFGVAETKIRGRPLAVQPVSIAYTELDHMPMGRRYRPEFAWFGDMDLLSHLLNLLRHGQATVVVVFHPVVTIADYAGRKALAAHCHRVVAEGVSDAISGRLAGDRRRWRLAAAMLRRRRRSLDRGGPGAKVEGS